MFILENWSIAGTDCSKNVPRWILLLESLMYTIGESVWATLMKGACIRVLIDSGGCASLTTFLRNCSLADFRISLDSIFYSLGYSSSNTVAFGGSLSFLTSIRLHLSVSWISRAFWTTYLFWAFCCPFLFSSDSCWAIIILIWSMDSLFERSVFFRSIFERMTSGGSKFWGPSASWLNSY